MDELGNVASYLSTAEQVLPIVIDRLAHGTDLREIVAAAALANARTFGGEDYVGFHAFMALMPAYEMSKDSHSDRKALPVLKVLYRSTNQIQTKGGRSSEVLHPIDALPLPTGLSGRDALVDAARHAQVDRAEGLFAGIAAHSATDAFNDLQALVQREHGPFGAAVRDPDRGRKNMDLFRDSVLKEVIPAVQSDYREAKLTPRERAILDYAVKLTKNPTATGRCDLESLRQHGLSDVELVDAVHCIGYFNFINRVLDGLGVDPESSMRYGKLSATA